MKLKHILYILIITSQFSGCSSRSKGFFEDLYSNTETRSATAQDYATVKVPKSAPIIRESAYEQQQKREERQSRSYPSKVSDSYHATGKIIEADYDKDVKLYVYIFLKSGSSNPISFYYDKDLRPIGRVMTINVKENFLISVSTTKSEKIDRANTTHRRYKKRIKSNLNTPDVEKINTL